MIRAVVIGAIAASVVVVFTAPAFGAPAEGIPELEQGFLQKAAERHQAEVALGQLALQKASSDRVKQYGARMIQDHQKVIDDVQKLIKKEGELSMPHQQMQRQLSQLSGKDFDKAYMSFMVQDHEKDLGELKQRAPTLTDPRVEHWTADALRIVKDHLEEAQAIATALGANLTHEPLAQDSSSQ
jgi:putative membrane protein